MAHVGRLYLMFDFIPIYLDAMHDERKIIRKQMRIFETSFNRHKLTSDKRIKKFYVNILWFLFKF